jgi:hypothetical protein
LLADLSIQIVHSTTFIHLAASLDQSEMAIAGTTLYLAQNVSVLIGIQIATTVLHERLRIGLDAGLEGVKHKSKVGDLLEGSLFFKGKRAQLIAHAPRLLKTPSQM